MTARPGTPPRIGITRAEWAALCELTATALGPPPSSVLPDAPEHLGGYRDAPPRALPVPPTVPMRTRTARAVVVLVSAVALVWLRFVRAWGPS